HRPGGNPGRHERVWQPGSRTRVLQSPGAVLTAGRHAPALSRTVEVVDLLYRAGEAATGTNGNSGLFIAHHQCSRSQGFPFLSGGLLFYRATPPVKIGQ